MSKPDKPTRASREISLTLITSAALLTSFAGCDDWNKSRFPSTQPTTRTSPHYWWHTGSRGWGTGRSWGSSRSWGSGGSSHYSSPRGGFGRSGGHFSGG